MHLHLIAFDIPYPANYGGAIDIYHKIRALSQAGIKVHLHCYEYGGKAHSSELSRICQSVHYYLRLPFLLSIPVNRPYIVSSRKSTTLLQRLISEPFPILFEGLHTCYHLDDPKLQNRLKLVRMHNVEWDYYQQLAKQEKHWIKKAYYKRESRLLQKFEPVLSQANHLLAISHKDQQYFSERFQTAQYLPAFHPYDAIASQPGKGEYCLYHGKLSVAENHRAAMFLIREVFRDLQIPLVIAGADPRPELITATSKYPHITLRHNVGEGEMLDLMREAHIHVLPTFQTTGIKLKLISALFTGRYCIVNPEMVQQTGLEDACLVMRSASDIKSMVVQLSRHEFSTDEIEKRRKLLLPQFSNKDNAQQLIHLLKGPEEMGLQAID